MTPEEKKKLIENYRKIKIKDTDFEKLDRETKLIIWEEDKKTENIWTEKIKQIQQEYKEKKIIVENRTQWKSFSGYLKEYLNDNKDLKLIHNILINANLYYNTKNDYITLPDGILSFSKKQLLEVENSILYFYGLQQIEKKYNVNIIISPYGLFEINDNTNNLDDEKKCSELEIKGELNPLTDDYAYLYLLKIIKEFKIFQKLPELKIKYLSELKNHIGRIKISLVPKTEEELKQEKENIENENCYYSLITRIESWINLTKKEKEEILKEEKELKQEKALNKYIEEIKEKFKKNEEFKKQILDLE